MQPDIRITKEIALGQRILKKASAISRHFNVENKVEGNQEKILLIDSIVGLR